MEGLNPYLVGVLGLVLGVFLGRYLLGILWRSQQRRAADKGEQIIKEAELKAESVKQQKIHETKDKVHKMRQDLEQDFFQRKQNLQKTENKLRSKEDQVHRKINENSRREAELESQKENVSAQLEIVQKKKADLDKLKAEQVSKLESMANLSQEDAKEQLIKALRDEAQTKASAYIKDIVDESKLTASKEARRVVLNTIQRVASEVTIENCVSVFNLDSDDVKGKIIGREGRNIRTLESATGVEIIVDDTPEAIIISGFDPVRREIARLSMHRLVSDGRIHPARIEEVVAKTKKDIESEIVEIGERTVIDLGIHGLHPELIKYVGRMRFRSSYGQNLLQHSREVANLCSLMASELGLNPKLAKRAGLLHDIGKVHPEEEELPHALVGMKLAEKYKEEWGMLVPLLEALRIPLKPK